MRVAFYTLGCKVNQYESAALSEKFMAAGFMLVEHNEPADVYVLNSCTVTGEADKKSRQLLRRFRRQNDDAIIVLCGCFPQAFPEDSATITEADIVLGTSNKQELLEHVKSFMNNGEKIVKIKNYKVSDKFEESSVSHFEGKTRAFVKIQDGCERFCSYCIIPFARGPVRSKSLDDLKLELEDLVTNGYKEVVLVGINLSCYGTDFGSELLDAINLASSIEGIERVRLGSLEPELLSRETIKAMSSQPKLCQQFHLSLQSGSDGTLKRMRRHYDTAEYTQIVDNLREAFDNCAITTDIMVGFPGETEQEFNESMEYAKYIKLAQAHVFSYSRRAGTAADEMPNQIDNSVKAKRSKQMIEVTNQTKIDFLDAQVGLVQEVLFQNKTSEDWDGYTPNYTLVSVSSEENLVKQIRKVEIVSHDNERCYGKLI